MYLTSTHTHTHRHTHTHTHAHTHTHTHTHTQTPSLYSLKYSSLDHVHEESLRVKILVHTQGTKLPEIGSCSMLLPVVVSDASLDGRSKETTKLITSKLSPLSSSSSGPSSPLMTLASSSVCHDQQTPLLPLSKLPILWPLSSSQLSDYTSSRPPSQDYSSFSSDHLWSAGQQLVGSQEGVFGDESPPSSLDDPAGADVFLGSTIPLCLHRP